MGITQEQIRLKVRAADWQDAIRKAGDLLVECGGAEEGYIEAMIRTVEEAGPYIVIAPGIAIPHARPEEGALETCFAVLVLEPPVNFGHQENDPVSLVVAFSSPSRDAHISTLTTLAKQFGRDGFLHDVKQARTKDELANLLHPST
jgi:mannitol/fructose-specific phosphotransferase system IIA component (Ntr-type)